MMNEMLQAFTLFLNACTPQSSYYKVLLILKIKTQHKGN